MMPWFHQNHCPTNSIQVYLLHYIVLVLFDHWIFGGSSVSSNRPEVVGSMLLLIIPLTLLIAYPFYMYVAIVSWSLKYDPGKALSCVTLQLVIMRHAICRATTAFLILSQLHRRTFCQIGANFLRFCSPKNTSMVAFAFALLASLQQSPTLPSPFSPHLSRKTVVYSLEWQ